MARHNEVTLTGILKNKPVIKKDMVTGDLKMAIVELIIVRQKRSRTSGQTYAIYANPSLITCEIDMIRNIETWQQWDVIDVRGFLGTKRVKKPSTCKSCGARNAVFGDLGYIYPKYADVKFRAGDESAAVDRLLSRYTEISNHITSIGNVIHKPQRMTLNTGKCGEIKLCQYQIALARTFHVKSDSPSTRTDFPWVKSYGVDCDENYYRLQKNSKVLLDGFLQTRRINRHTVCPACGASYDWVDRTLEIVPYRSEYLQNCRSTEEVENLRLSEEEQAYQQQTARIQHKASYGDEVLDERMVAVGS